MNSALIFANIFIFCQIEFVEQQVIKRRDRKSFMVPTDPLYPTQWNLVEKRMENGRYCCFVFVVQLNSGQYGQELVGNDLNVEKAWLQGLTGCNVTVAVVDDGICTPFCTPVHLSALWACACTE